MSEAGKSVLPSLSNSPIDAGVASVPSFSLDLKKLNESKQEGSHRDTYRLFAITCTCVWGYHADDGVVPLGSALGFGVVNKKFRTVT
jgi:hypothetical protein